MDGSTWFLLVVCVSGRPNDSGLGKVAVRFCEQPRLALAVANSPVLRGTKVIRAWHPD
jgi:hypothetical protein